MFDFAKNSEIMVMTHVELAGKTPVFYMNGEQCSLKEWSVIAGKKECEENGVEVDKEKIKWFKKRTWGTTLGQLATMTIWACKKVKDMYDTVAYQYF